MKKIVTAFFAILLSVGVTHPAEATLPRPQVFIVSGSDINIVSRDSKIPVSVQNNYDRSIRIRVHTRSTNPSLNVSEYVSLTVPANSRKDALVPINIISGGEYKLKVWVTTFTDIRLGQTVELNLTANPDIELVIMVGFAGLLFVLVSLGAVRMIRRGKSKVTA